MMNKKLNFIDLFAGAGGLSEGFIRRGFNVVAHVEMDKNACDTLKTRAAYHFLLENNDEQVYYDYLKSPHKNKKELWAKVPNKIIDKIINKEITKNTINDIFKTIDKILGDEKVDLIIGGPPCQAYSIIGRANDKNGMKNDPRNFLFLHYIKFLERYKPKMFVFENVVGILSAGNGLYLKKIFEAANQVGYHISKPPLNYLNAKNYNVLQDRKRVIIIGWKKELKLSYPNLEERAHKYTISKDLFIDLPKIQQGENVEKQVLEYTCNATPYLSLSKIRDKKINFITQHFSRKVNENDKEIYEIAIKNLGRGIRLKYASLPKHLRKYKDAYNFSNKFKVVNGKNISHTITANISKCGHQFIHPDILQIRSISLREAARVQSFPDDYFFEGSRTSAFKQIGNAVPVLMAERIAEKLKNIL